VHLPLERAYPFVRPTGVRPVALYMLPENRDGSTDASATSSPVAAGVPPVVARAPGHRGEGVRGEVGEDAGCARDREAGVVAGRVQAVGPEIPAPADPSVAGKATVCAGLPVGKADPPSPPLEHAAQATTRKALESRAVMPVHEFVPAAALAGKRRAGGHIGNPEIRRCGRKDR